MRTRLSLLVMTTMLAVVLVACGRASKQQIDAALGITPTLTLSADQVASATAGAESARATQSAMLTSGSPSAEDPLALSAMGDVTKGASEFRFKCAGCHRPTGGGKAAALAGASNPAATMSDQQIEDLLRNGLNSHPKLDSSKIGDEALYNILAYIRSQ